MAVIITTSVPIKPDKLDEAIAFMRETLPDTRAYAGCQFLEICQDKDTPGILFSYSRWDSKEQYEKYVAWRTETGTMAAFGEFVDAPPVTTYNDRNDA